MISCYFGFLQVLEADVERLQKIAVTLQEREEYIEKLEVGFVFDAYFSWPFLISLQN